MAQRARKDTNLFSKLTLAELEQVLERQYVETIRTESANAYWMLGECERELQERKRLSVENLVDCVCDMTGDAIRPKHALTIRESHDDMESLAGMTVREAWEHRRETKAKSNGNGRAPRHRDARPPKAKTVPSPNGNGAKRSRVIAKNTLSFSCSKVMKYLRTPKDVWERLSKEFAFTVDACASDANRLVDRHWTEREDGLKQDWTGEVVYCHPMFDGKIGRWVSRGAVG